MLSHEAELCIAGPVLSGRATLLEAINYLQPDSIILNYFYFLTLPLDLVVELLMYYPHMQLIIVNPADDRVKIYSKNQIRITCVVDLIDLLRGAKNWLHGIPYLFASYELGNNQLNSLSSPVCF